MANVYAIFAASLLFLIFLLRKISEWRRLPPGPWGLPFIGYLPWISPKAPHETLTNLARKYGPVYGLKMGSLYTVVLSDPRLIRQAFAKDSFSGRAPLYLTHGIMKGYADQGRKYWDGSPAMSWNYYQISGKGLESESNIEPELLYRRFYQTNFMAGAPGIICAEGDLWRDQRKFVGNCLRNFGMAKAGPRRDKLEERIIPFVNECIKKLEARSTGNGIDPLAILHHSVGNLINEIVFGKTYDEDDEVWKWLRHLQEEGVKHIGVAGPLNFLPFLRFLPRYRKIMDTLLDGQKKTHEHYQSLAEEQRGRSENADSFLKLFDNEMTARKDSNDLGYFTEPQFHYLLADLFGAGTDTSLTTLRWFLLYMAAYPKVQEEIYHEMRQTLNDKTPTLDDRQILTRLEAAISEIQRIRSVVPVGIPHGTTQNVQIGEYEVPKGTMVVPLQWAIHTDPAHWKDPHDFNPDRFIASDGSILKPEAFIPFQVGKRMCIGDELARMILFLFAGRILHAFTVSVPPEETIDLEGECGITLVPKPHFLVFAPREH